MPVPANSRRQSGTAWVFAGGALAMSTRQRCRRRLEREGRPERVVAVDAGLHHVHALSMEPDWLVGDFDSVDETELKRLPETVECMRLEQDKNANDLEAALDRLAQTSIEVVELYALSGGRTDHMLFNWLLPMRREWPFSLWLNDGSCRARCVRPRRPFKLSMRKGITVSLLPLPEAQGVSTEGLAWPLQDETLCQGSTRGLSNRVGDARFDDTAKAKGNVNVYVEVASGCLLVMYSPDD